MSDMTRHRIGYGEGEKRVSDRRRTASTLEGHGLEVATFIGDEGQLVARALTRVALGLESPSSLGPACDFAEDGTLRLTVDEATFAALGLKR